MVLNANVILLMAAVVLALFAVVQLPKLFALLKGEPKEAPATTPAQPVKTVAVYQPEKAPKKATAKKATAPKTATQKTTHRKTTQSAGKKSPRSRKKS